LEGRKNKRKGGIHSKSIEMIRFHPLEKKRVEKGGVVRFSPYRGEIHYNKRAEVKKKSYWSLAEGYQLGKGDK